MSHQPTRRQSDGELGLDRAPPAARSGPGSRARDSPTESAPGSAYTTAARAPGDVRASTTCPQLAPPARPGSRPGAAPPSQATTPASKPCSRPGRARREPARWRGSPLDDRRHRLREVVLHSEAGPRAAHAGARDVSLARPGVAASADRAPGRRSHGSARAAPSSPAAPPDPAAPAGRRTDRGPPTARARCTPHGARRPTHRARGQPADLMLRRSRRPGPDAWSRAPAAGRRTTVRSGRMPAP